MPDISQMPHLHTLELARNHLSSLGSNQVTSASLCCLDLSHNELTELSQLQHLPLLRELNVSDNQLTSLGALQVSCNAAGMFQEYSQPCYLRLVVSCVCINGT